MIKIIGIGNRIMGDDGIALKILEEIEDKIKIINSKIEIIIGETDFEYCLDKINDNDFVIIIDSTCLGLQSGEITLLSFEECQNHLIKKSDSQHDISLIDMVIKYKNNIHGYIIGIEVHDVDFNLNISHILNYMFKDICSEVLNKIKIILNNMEAGV